MQFKARFSEVEARGAKLEGDGERIYVLFGRGGGPMCAVVEADAFEALYELKEPVAVAPIIEDTLVRRGKIAEPEKRKRLNDPAPAAIREHTGSAQGEPAKKILVALAKRPMSSSELSAFTGLVGSPLYSTCNYLKTRGTIESFNDDGPGGDGTRRYRLPVAK